VAHVAPLVLSADLSNAEFDDGSRKGSRLTWMCVSGIHEVIVRQFVRGR